MKHDISLQVMSANNEQTEEHIEKQDKVLNQLGNKRQMVLDFLSKGEKLMEDPNCPKFLEGHAKKLKEAWEETTEKANARKKALAGWFGIQIGIGICHDDHTFCRQPQLLGDFRDSEGGVPPPAGRRGQGLCLHQEDL